MPRRYTRRRSRVARKSTVRYGKPGVRRSGFSKGFKWGYSAVWSAIKSLKGLINVEHKYVDTDIANNTNITGAGPANTVPHLLNGVAQGDSENQRNGHSIRVKSLAVTFDCKFTTGGNATQLIRWAIVRHPDTEGNEPDQTKIWAAPATFDTLRNLNFPHEVQFVREGRLKLDANTLVRHQKVFVPIDFRQVFDGVDATVASITRNSLYFYIWGDTAANFPQITNFTSRLRYIDN